MFSKIGFCKRIFLQKGGNILPEKNNEKYKRDGFVKLPKRLFTDESGSTLSPVSILIYSILADRASLSKQNGWIDSDGRVFIFFTINEMAKLVGRGKDCVLRSFKQLEKNGMIERKRLGQGKPSKIYINDFGNSEFKTSENANSGVMKNRSQDFAKSESNNTEINNTDFSNTYLSSDVQRYDAIRQKLEDNLEYDCLVHSREKTEVDELITLMADTVVSNAPTVRIAGQDVPKALVERRFYELDEEHICYVLDRFDENKSEIRNVRAYLLTALYNAPTTMDNYYTQLVKRNMNSA